MDMDESGVQNLLKILLNLQDRLKYLMFKR